MPLSPSHPCLISDVRCCFICNRQECQVIEVPTRNLRYADVQGPTGPILRSQEPKAQGMLAKAEAKVGLCDSLAFASTILVDWLRFSIAMLWKGLSRVVSSVFALSNLLSFSIHPSWMLERHWQSCCTPDRWIRRKNSRKLPSSC